MNPIKCVNYLLQTENEKLRYYCEQMVLSLYVIDEVVESRLNSSYHYYIQGDSCLIYLLNKTIICDLDIELFNKSIILLDVSKLIYRFTCAKKFYINGDSIKQLRLNSWGKEYIIQRNLISEYKNNYDLILRFFEQNRCAMACQGYA